MFKVSPNLKKRERWHRLLNKGHRFALLDTNNKIIDSAREERALRLKLAFYRDLTLIDIAKHLDSLI